MFYVFLAEGFEEIEALATVDILRRGGVEVKTVGVTGKTVTGSHGIPVTADIETDAVNPFDIEGVVLPGGIPGTPNLEADAIVQRTLDFASANNKFICAICAAPSILGHKGLLNGKSAVCFPGFEQELVGATVLKNKVVIDGKTITGVGAGATLDFAFAILSEVKGEDAAKKLRSSMIA